jgi:hypothetical protein
MTNRQSPEHPPCPFPAVRQSKGYSLHLAFYEKKEQAEAVVKWICEGSNDSWGHARCGLFKVADSDQWAIEYHHRNERNPE